MAYTSWKDLEQVEKYAKRRYLSWDQRWLNRREQALVANLFQEYQLGGTILDVPVGYGRFLPVLKQFGRVYAADWGWMPLVYQVKKVGISAGSVNGDAKALPFKHQSVDVIFCLRLLQHMHKGEERHAILKEFRRVSRKWIVTSVYLKSRVHALHRTLSKKPSRITMLSKEQFTHEVVSAGLQIVQQRAVFPWIHAHHIFLISTDQRM